MELETLLMAESIAAIYVADYETDELLYLNEAAKKILYVQGPIESGRKCYNYLMNRDIPCPFCHKSMFTEDDFIDNVIKFPFNGHNYKISSKVINWNDRKVHIHYIIDVTDLMDEEKKLRTLTDHIPTGIGIYYVYPDGRLEAGYINDGYYNMIESTREDRTEYDGFAAINAIHPEDVTQARSEIKSGIQQNRQIYLEVRIKKDDGTYKWVSIRADIYSKTKDRVTLYCAYSDIDALKKNQKEQEERQHHYEEEIRLKTSVSGDAKVLAIADLSSDMIREKIISNSSLIMESVGKTIDEVIDYICNNYVYDSERENYKKTFNRQKMLSD